jgi:hypothetical protein
LKAKASLGLQDARLVDVNAHRQPWSPGPKNLAFGQQVADSAITLVRDNGKVLPLKVFTKEYQGTAKGALPYTTHRGDARSGGRGAVSPTM